MSAPPNVGDPFGRIVRGWLRPPAGLLEEILAESARFPAADRVMSSEGPAWHSARSRSVEPFVVLAGNLTGHGGGFSARWWSNVLYPGAVHKYHDHGPNPAGKRWSFAYFLTYGAPLCFVRAGESTIAVDYQAMPGRLVVFPAELRHGVPGPIESARVSISGNLDYP